MAATSRYYRITASNRTDLDDESRNNDEKTLIHYDATQDLRVVGGKFVEEKNEIPSLTFDIYPDNPGYNVLTEFDTLITYEQMHDASAARYVGIPVVELELLDGTEDEYRLRFLDISLATTAQLSGDDYLLILDYYSYAEPITDAAGIIIDPDIYRLYFENKDDGTTYPVSDEIFEGRVISNTIHLESDNLYYRSIVCEGMLGFLNDSMQPYMEERLWADDVESSGLYKYMQHLLDVHNSQVEEHKRIYISVCDTTTNLTNEQVVKGTNWQTTWECISEKLLDVYGGEIKIERGTDGLLYLYYTDKMSELNVITKPIQPVHLGVNVGGGDNEPQVMQVITRLYPLGAKLEDDEGNETEERLTIAGASGSGGLEYIEDTAMKRIYGIVPATNTWDDVTIADNLYTKAVDWLADNNNYPVSLSITAYDLTLGGYDYEYLDLYSDVYVDVEPLETDGLADDGKIEIIKRTVNVDTPWMQTLEFGETTMTASKRYARLTGSVSLLEQ